MMNMIISNKNVHSTIVEAAKALGITIPIQEILVEAGAKKFIFDSFPNGSINVNSYEEQVKHLISNYHVN